MKITNWRRATRAVLGLACLLLPVAAFGQSDPQAVVALEQAIATTGRVNNVQPVEDFVAQGTITYHWAGEEVSGAATVRGRAPDEFRVNAQLSDGARSFAWSRGRGWLSTADAAAKPLALHNTINLGVLIFPGLTLQAWLADPLTVVQDRGMVKAGDGRTLHQIHLERHFAAGADPSGELAKLCVTDYFIDPATGLIVETLDQTHPSKTFLRSYPQEIDLENYRETDGVRVPMLVREKIDGQTVWELRLDTVAFNTGLADADFSAH